MTTDTLLLLPATTRNPASCAIWMVTAAQCTRHPMTSQLDVISGDFSTWKSKSNMCHKHQVAVKTTGNGSFRPKVLLFGLIWWRMRYALAKPLCYTGRQTRLFDAGWSQTTLRTGSFRGAVSCNAWKVAWAPFGTGCGALLLTGGSDGRVRDSALRAVQNSRRIGTGSYAPEMSDSNG